MLSVWAFVFNRKGQLLLHQRSASTKDNRLLWDKSVGGHVDLRDTSTSVTAKRELVEELLLPEAEYTRYVRADLGDIVDFGEWNPRKRPERYLRDAFLGLDSNDWILFRATDQAGSPLTVTRISLRRIHDADGSVATKSAMFTGDIYFFIAPAGYMDSDEQMKSLVHLAEETGAARDHRLVTLDELRKWIGEAVEGGFAEEVFTDDLSYMCMSYNDALAGFAAFVESAFR